MGETRVEKLVEPASMEECAAAMKLLYTWAREHTDTPYEACGPIVDMFEAVFPEEEATMNLKANG